MAASDFAPPSCRDGALLSPAERAVNTARVLTQRVGNLVSSDGNVATDGTAPTDGNLTTAHRLGLLDIGGNLGSGQTLHEVIRATVLALGRGVGAAAFRVDFFVRWGCDAGQGCDGRDGCSNSGDNGCNDQSASLYLNEVELGFSAGSAIGWLGAMSKARPVKVRPQWRRAGFTSAVGCLGRHQGAVSLGQSVLLFT